MLNILILTVFSAVTLFFAYYIASSASYAKRSAKLDDAHCLVRAVGAIILSITVIAALWIEAAFYYFV
ncbi:hypothetical protein SAMN02910298_01200 [Pseudobutyrivibrio sp. YE44]|uniref:hypothetical protein n=1 Tax=Pseudobutyrivibrio sp. YE44 TaxID=1520802 RepID=UPI00087EDCF6|nr:hypothetical protein [Pseudobutyrivibrio sp. YE44]SDB24198.1 hypothetical protein SAMN02910298_01200 [Pseudobutyrivibrio sp. YE44]